MNLIIIHNFFKHTLSLVLINYFLSIPFSGSNPACANICDQSACVDPIDCIHGVVLDQCLCCKQCLRQLGEKCGHRIGRCAQGLTCIQLEHHSFGVCHSIDCRNVQCEQTNRVNKSCPSDSYKVAQTNSCCDYSCACLPQVCHSRCQKHQIPKVVRKGNKMPGSCCDIVECIDAPLNCIHNNTQRLNGEEWQHDSCTSCFCKNGLTFCQVKKCRLDQANVELNSDCISPAGRRYQNKQTWQEDSCTQCQCVDGQLQCISSLCERVECDNPIFEVGRCCPICSKQHCNLSCSFGYKKDKQGLEMCECNDCVESKNKCTNRCQFGFKTDKNGCRTCDCLTETTNSVDSYNEFSLNTLFPLVLFFFILSIALLILASIFKRLKSKSPVLRNYAKEDLKEKEVLSIT